MQQRLIGLDGLRGIAALCVLLYHLQIYLIGHSASLAYHAVDFFFMLSGYVMAKTYESRWTGMPSAGPFLRSRIKRLWPTMMIGALISAPLAWILLPASEASIVMLNIFLIPTFIGLFFYPLNISAWSILMEILANLLHVVILARLKIRALAAVAVVSLLFLLAATATGVGEDDSFFGAGAKNGDFIFGLSRVMLAYTIGIILWRKWKDEPPIKIPPLFTLIAMPLFFVASMAVANGRTSWMLAVLFILVLCPTIIAGGLRIGESRWAPLMRLAGELSFPLYAVHVPIIIVVRYLEGGYAASFIASIVIASLFPNARRALADVVVTMRTTGVMLGHRRMMQHL